MIPECTHINSTGRRWGQLRARQGRGRCQENAGRCLPDTSVPPGAEKLQKDLDRKAREWAQHWVGPDLLCILAFGSLGAEAH